MTHPVTYQSPPRDFILDILTWLREEVYPGLIGHALDDEGIAAWLVDRYISLWQTIVDAPLQRHQRAKERLFAEIQAQVAPLPEPGLLGPLIIGRWQGNFLYPFDEAFFGPACAAWDADRRARYFARITARGDTHVVINADQDDWGPLVGHPEYTAGGFRAYLGDGLAQLLAVLVEARRAGLVPCVGIVDQQTLLSWPLLRVIDWTRQLVDVTAEHVALYMLSWEINEVWTTGDIREPNLERWIMSVRWLGRDVGIHFSGGVLSGGLTFYGRMPPNVTRLYQWEYGRPEEVLIEEAHLIADVAARTNTKVCAFEHSSQNQAPYYTETQCVARAALARTALGQHGLRPEQLGSLNG